MYKITHFIVLPPFLNILFFFPPLFVLFPFNLEIAIFTYSEVFYSVMSSLLGSSKVFFILLVLLISSFGAGRVVVFFIRISVSLFALLICFCILSCFIY